LSKIEIEGLHKTYASRNGRVAALADVTLSIKQNEFVTLVGPSGCGKSTLLKLIGALIRPSGGKLLFDGAPLFHPTRDVGIVFQEAVLLEWRTVLDNVLLRKFSASTGGNRAPAPWTSSLSSGSAGSSGAIRGNSPAGCSSGSRCAGRSSMIPRSFSWTSRSPRSTP
jgi:ABC-type nitrate/sulfonate/bicarbonate transport system ATPase subunit